MPSKSKPQARFMAACAHGWKPKGLPCPPMHVAKDFNKADAAARKKAKAK